MVSLEKYGKTLREYEGAGQVALSDGQICNSAVHAVQIADGRILVLCDCDNSGILASCYNKTAQVLSIKATTKDNLELLIDRDILLTQLQPLFRMEMVFLVGSLKCTKKQQKAVTSVRYGITNLEFCGNKLVSDGRGGGAWNILSVDIGGKNIEIHEIPNHTKIFDLVEAQRGIDVTCEAVIHVSSAFDLDEATQHIDVLCKLLSLARGTKISWVYYDCYTDSGELVLTTHRNSVAWRYAGLRLIDPGTPNDTANFVKRAYPNYLAKNKDYGLDIAIESYLDAKRESGYLETRALMAVVTLELLRARYTKKKGDEFFLRRGQFEKVRRTIEQALYAIACLRPLPFKMAEGMAAKIGELNRPSFKTALGNMLTDLEICLPQPDLERFINIRDSLVHQGSFLTTECWQEYSLIFGILDRIFPEDSFV